MSSDRPALSGSVRLERGRPAGPVDPAVDIGGSTSDGGAKPGGTAVLQLSGEVDLAEETVLQDLLDEVASLGAAHVVVDATGVSFCDAHGLGLLVAAAERLRRAGCELSVRGADARLYRLFQTTGLIEWLRVERPAVGVALVRELQLSTVGAQFQGVVDAALGLVVTMAKAVVQRADGVSITLARDGTFATVAASNETVLDMDHDQYATGQGPCLDAARHSKRFQTTSLETEARWPNFVPRARERGIQSILSTPLVTGQGPAGALNIYSRTVRAFAVHETDWADQFAAHASTVLASARAGATPRLLDAQIVEALLSREVIALAQGVLMERYGVSPEAAHTRLLSISRQTSRPLRDVCERLVDRVRSADPTAVGTDGGPDGRPSG